MSQNVEINKHPIYQDPRFITEKTILEKLVQICGFDTSVGVVDFYHKVPTVQIGFIDEENNVEGQMPSFVRGSSIEIALTDSFEPIKLPKKLSFKALQKIVVPWAKNWIEVTTFLINFYEGELGKELSNENLKEWKKEFAS